MVNVQDIIDSMIDVGWFTFWPVTRANLYIQELKRKLANCEYIYSFSLDKKGKIYVKSVYNLKVLDKELLKRIVRSQYYVFQHSILSVDKLEKEIEKSVKEYEILRGRKI